MLHPVAWPRVAATRHADGNLVAKASGTIGIDKLDRCFALGGGPAMLGNIVGINVAGLPFPLAVAFVPPRKGLRLPGVT